MRNLCALPLLLDLDEQEEEKEEVVRKPRITDVTTETS